MRIPFFFALFLFGNSLLSQEYFYRLLPATSAENTDVRVFLPAHFSEDDRCLLKPGSMHQNRYGQQLNYHCFFMGLPCENAGISYSRFAAGGLLNGNLPDPRKINPDTRFPGANAWIYLSPRDAWVAAAKSLVYDSVSYTCSEIYRDAANEPIAVQPLKRRLGKDTSVKSKVFMPDPLSSANVLYGGFVRDRKDSNSLFLEQQLFVRDLQVKKTGDTLRLGDDLISLAELSPPLFPATFSTTDMQFSRNDPRFEDVMVSWHLQSLRNWWTALGFGHYADTVVIDAHAYNGSDESGFTALPGTPTIEFGTGGVDDAEDADAIVHEYTHAAFNHIRPGSYWGLQRQSVEEGICDFMALAYSARHTAVQAGWVYNWDGHNEFWPGRNLFNSKKYPQSITNQIHVDGEIFGAALYDLASEIGMDSTVTIVMAGIPLLSGGLSMPQCAELFLKADSLMHGGKYRWEIIKAFYPRGLLPTVRIQHPGQADKFILRNSMAFAQSRSDLEIIGQAGSVFKIYAVNGKCLFSLTLDSEGKASLRPDSLQSGFYLLGHGREAIKILKF